MECTCLRSQLDRLAKPDLSQGRWIDARRGDWQRFAMSKRLTKGAHLLDAPTIRRVVKSGQMGIYHLGYFQPGDGLDIRVLRVGRSDGDLQARLLQHAQSQLGAWDARGCSYFFFDYVDSVQEAFIGECELYHGNGNPPRNNDPKQHPLQPQGVARKVLCPERNCPHSKP